MKTNKIALILTSFTLAFGVCTFIGVRNTNQEVDVTFAEGYEHGDGATYYNTIDSSLTGDSLLTALRSLNNSKKKENGGYSALLSGKKWARYTDYDPNSNILYDSKGMPYSTTILSFYSGNKSNDGSGMNREHVWPDSRGGNLVEGDTHMARPTLTSENSSRGNSFYVEGKASTTSGWDPGAETWGDATYRGDSARIIFYCAMANSNLTLIDETNDNQNNKTMGKLSDLIKWNINYPVSLRERNRNEGVEYIQGNRNPFIDHPEYACKIWGNYNSAIKTMCENAHWDVTDYIDLSRYTASITEEETFDIKATSSDGSEITWSTSDSEVASISTTSSASGVNVTVTGVSAGTATITAKATINSVELSKTCTVTVTSSGSGSGGGGSDDDVTIAVSDIPSTYSTNSFTASGYSFGCSNIGNSYSSGSMQFKSGQGYLYNTTPISNISSITIANGATGSFSGTVYVGSSSHPTSGTSYTITNGQTVNISGSPSYFTIQAGSVSGGAKCGNITIGRSVSKTLSSIAVSTAPSKTTYTAGEYFDPTGLVITRTYSDSTSDTYTYSGHTSEFSFTPSTSTALTTSNTSVTISYGGKSTTQAITVNPVSVALSSISISTAPSKTTYTAGEYFDPTGLVIKRTYSDSTYDTYTYSGHASEFSFVPSTSTALTTSNTSVSITYGGKSCNQAITVNPAPKVLSSISVATAPTKTSYTVGEYFDPTGLVITRTYTDSTSDTYTYSGHASEFNFAPSTSTALTTSDTSVSISYGGKSCSQAITVKSSGGSSIYTETITMSEQGFSNQQDVTTINGSVVDVTFAKSTGNNGPKYYDTGSAVRVYPNNTITVSSSKTIVGITFTFSSGEGSNSISSNPSGWSSPTWTGSANSVTFTIGGTTGHRRIAKIDIEYESSGSVDTAISITATLKSEKTFYVGETISKSDILVKTNTNVNVTSEVNFPDYQFKYSDAVSGGDETNKEFNISYESLHTTLVVKVQRKAYGTSTEVLSHTGSEFSSGGIGSNYATGQIATVDNVMFTVDGYIYSGRLSLSETKTSATGKVQNITPYSHGIINVTVNGASPDIQLSTNGDAWVDLASATPDTENYLYLKIFYKNTTQSNYVNINSIDVTIKADENATNVSNYVMFEDTNNQCTTKLYVTIAMLNSLSTSELEKFQNSNDYVIASARVRLEAWAKNQDKTIDYSEGASSVTLKSNKTIFVNEDNIEDNTMVIVAIIASISAIAFTTLLVFKKKRH